jgi:hypothetical protein
MSRRFSIVLVAVLAVGSAHAGDTLFTFDDGFLASGSGDIGVSLYMGKSGVTSGFRNYSLDAAAEAW